MSTSDWSEQVLHFWFDELEPRSWFRKDERVDALIRTRFGALHERVTTMRPDEFATPERCLAAVLVLDQFSRNMYRGTPGAFAGDELALAIAQHAVAAGYDAGLTKDQRLFLYMPFEHSESAAMQDRCMQLVASLDDPGLLDYARRHKDVIDRFGRFPHRNEALGRSSTPAELEYIRTNRGF
jgi:uncharacterized protein (DUF924 family)